MQIVSNAGDNLYEMSNRVFLHEINPVFWEEKKNVINLSPAELAQRVVKVKANRFTFLHILKCIFLQS